MWENVKKKKKKSKGKNLAGARVSVSEENEM